MPYLGVYKPYPRVYSPGVKMYDANPRIFYQARIVADRKQSVAEERVSDFLAAGHFIMGGGTVEKATPAETPTSKGDAVKSSGKKSAAQSKRKSVARAVKDLLLRMLRWFR